VEAIMRITKFKPTQPSGLVPAGTYFQRLATDLRQANEREAKLRAELDAEDRALEALYRRSSQSRTNTYTEAAA